MKKSHIRDYATEAIRFYAEEGSPEKYRQRKWEEAVLAQHQLEGNTSNGISNPSEAAVVRAESAIEKAAAEISDLMAVEKAIYIIEHMHEGSSIMAAVKMVYMEEPEKELEKGEFSVRVHQAELRIPSSEPTIWRWLRDVRIIVAVQRGLRLSDGERKRYEQMCEAWARYGLYHEQAERERRIQSRC